MPMAEARAASTSRSRSASSSPSRGSTEPMSTEVRLRIRRYHPETDAEPLCEEYRVEAEPSDRVLDLLHQVKWYQDGTLTFRRSCGHGVCGSDAMLINGRNRLACEYLVKDAGNRITVEPIHGLPLVKDLLVDMDPF